MSLLNAKYRGAAGGRAAGRAGGGGRQGDSMLKQKDFGYHLYVSYYTVLKDVLV